MMQIVVQKSGFWFCGRIEDLMDYLGQYPPETTLKDLIKVHLN
jgi:hypothetical protein